MTARFKKFAFHTTEREGDRSMVMPTSLMGLPAAAEAMSEEVAAAMPKPLNNDEAAARYYASELLGASGDEEMMEVVAPSVGEAVPSLDLLRTEESPLTGTRSLHFAQRAQSVPIFGTNAVVEISGESRSLISFDAELTNAPDVSPIASISASDGLSRIAEYCDVAPGGLEGASAPTLTYFAEEDGGDWHLTYHFENLAAIPPAVREDELSSSDERSTEYKDGHGLGPSPRQDFRRFDFFVDAHSGEVIYYFSSQPTLDVPTPCRGQDELGKSRDFWGLSTGTLFEMSDPVRRIQTYDHNFGDITNSGLPPAPISNSATDFGVAHTAGVSAHWNATVVFDFFNNVLKRNGIDGKGMSLLSMVNCTYSQHSAPPDWRNAVWWQGRMWYGQVKDNQGGFDSYARYLDVVAHELTHGVTESTSALVYRDLSGALNESFSDIFGVMIANWFPNEPNPIGSWNWRLGDGLGTGGGPLRDLSDPTVTGDPDHWSKRKFVGTSHDNGGVHVNSNIHNKAAYNLCTSTDGGGNLVLQPQETALLYYLALTRLGRRADFKDCLRVLKIVARTYFAGDATRQDTVLAAIDSAYGQVGIV